MTKGLGDLPPYPAYRQSGVAWLGNVPEEWSLLRAKTLLRERVEKGFPDEPLLAATQTKGVVRKERYENRTVEAMKDLHLLKLVRVGDFVISLRSFQGGIEFAREQGIISPAYTVLQANHPEEHGYLAWLFKSRPFVENLSLYVTGIRQGQNIDYEKLARSVLPLPPIPEQAAIVRFLDHVDRQIRRYIRTKQKLIKLLEEQKQAIIHRAVTRGLDPNVRLKPSGVAWLGEVPEHWEVMALRRRWSVTDCKHLTVPFVPEGIPLASVRETQSFELNLTTSNHTTDEWYEKLIEGGRRPQKGDLIYCRNVSVGAAALVTGDERFAMGQDVCLIRSSSENQRWLNYVLHSRVMADQLAVLQVGSTFNRINVADIKGLLVAVPPRSEQGEVVGFLDDCLRKIDVAIERPRREMRLLGEFRTRLIADVVTGKLDVREAAARIRDDVSLPPGDDEGDTMAEDVDTVADDPDAAPEETDS